MDYNYIKAIHIIFVICWFAALFYIVRLFIYTKEAQTKDEISRPILTNQLLIMQKKLWYIIGWPSMIGALIFGLWLLFKNPVLFSYPWMWLKLIVVGLLTVYHLQCQLIYKQQSNGIFKYTSLKLRLFNELATLFLVAIVFLVIIKSTSGLLWGLLGLIAFAAILFIAIKIYRKQSNSKEIPQQEIDNQKESNTSTVTPPTPPSV